MPSESNIFGNCPAGILNCIQITDSTWFQSISQFTMKLDFDVKINGRKYKISSKNKLNRCWWHIALVGDKTMYLAKISSAVHIATLSSTFNYLVSYMLKLLPTLNHQKTSSTSPPTNFLSASFLSKHRLKTSLSGLSNTCILKSILNGPIYLF